jgi:hypothetical protein
VSVICGAQGSQIRVSGFARSNYVFASPREKTMGVFHSDDIRNHSRMLAVSVGKRVDDDKLVMKIGRHTRPPRTPCYLASTLHFPGAGRARQSFRGKPCPKGNQS